MNLFLLYLLLLKATLTSFSGMTSLPEVRNDFVAERHVLTDRQLNTAVVAGRTGPGPNGLYLVSVGYFIDGLPGAFAGLVALITPAFLVIPMVRWLRTRARTPRIRSAIRAIVLASAGLLLAASLPLAGDAITGAVTLAIVVLTALLLSFTRVDSAWVMLGAALVGLAAKT
jgi:chromate transporter